MTQGNIFSFLNGAFRADVQANTLTADRLIKYPDANGTLIIADPTNGIPVSDIKRIGILSLQTDTPLFIPGGRITNSSSDPVGESDNIGTVRYVPFSSNLVPLWDSAISQWVYRTFPLTDGLPTAVGSLTPLSRPHDFCLYLNNGNLALTTRAWSSNTNRGLELDRNGIVYSLNLGTGNLAKATYIATAYMEGSANSGKTNTTETMRNLYNAYNQVPKILLRKETTSSWTYSTPSWRSLNNSTANRVTLLDGIGNGIVDLSIQARVQSLVPGVFARISLGLNSTASPSNGYAAIGAGDAAGVNQSITHRTRRVPGIGYRYVQALEYCDNGGGGSAVTFFGDSGDTTFMVGEWMC